VPEEVQGAFDVGRYELLERLRPVAEAGLADDRGDAWVFLALQDASGVTGQRLSSGVLAEELRRNGWELTAENVLYQTPGGGLKEFKFEK